MKNTNTEKTLNELRKACKTEGFTVKKQTLTDGPFVKFFYNGTSSTCITFPKHKELNAIKEKFHGLEIAGRKVYGLTKREY